MEELSNPSIKALKDFAASLTSGDLKKEQITNTLEKVAPEFVTDHFRPTVVTTLEQYLQLKCLVARIPQSTNMIMNPNLKNEDIFKGDWKSTQALYRFKTAMKKFDSQLENTQKLERDYLEFNKQLNELAKDNQLPPKAKEKILNKVDEWLKQPLYDVVEKYDTDPDYSLHADLSEMTKTLLELQNPVENTPPKNMAQRMLAMKKSPIELIINKLLNAVKRLEKGIREGIAQKKEKVAAPSIPSRTKEAPPPIPPRAKAAPPPIPSRPQRKDPSEESSSGGLRMG